MLPPLVFYAFFAICCIYALWRGGGPERFVTLAFMLAALGTALFNLPASQRFYSVAIGVFAVDVVLFLALLVIALKADRFWPLLVVSLQAVTILAHLIKFADPDLIRRAYSIMAAVWSYPQLILLVVGTARHQARLRRDGSDPSWRGSSQ